MFLLRAKGVNSLATGLPEYKDTHVGKAFPSSEMRISAISISNSGQYEDMAVGMSR
jgi:hypothetical protein